MIVRYKEDVRTPKNKKRRTIMKKLLSIIFCLSLLFLVAAPASAAAFTPARVGSKIPIVFIAGDGEPIYDENDQQILKISENGILGMFDKSKDENGDETADNNELYMSVANVLMPFLVDGLLKDNWQPYFDHLEKEIGDLFAGSRLDNDGNAPAGTGISSARRATVAYDRAHNKMGSKGYYDMYDYQLWYDWRLDPMENARQLKAYVDDVKAATGADKVALASACLGGNVVMAYLKQFGTDDLAGVGMLAPLAKGSEFLSQMISGRFRVDMDGLNRILTDTAAIDNFNMPAFASATIDLLAKSGLYERLSDSVKKTIYAKVIEGTTSALALSTIFTMPCYWSCVAEEDYDTAMQYVFGDAGSEKRTQYAGLIEKIETYHNEVALHADDLMQQVDDSAANLAILCKYGFQMVPLCEDSALVSDQYVSVKRASFGATTSTIFDTLPDDYVAAQTAAGLGKYISPDKQVDASTAPYRDYTWFTKNATHTLRTDAELRIMYTVITADHQLTVDDFDLTQFMVYDHTNKTTAVMTEDNCHTEHWTEDEMKQPSTDKKAAIFTGLLSFFKWLVEMFKLIRTKIGK